MSPTLRNVLAVVVGAIVCLVLNGIVLGLMMKAIPPPEGFDPNDPASYDLLQTRHLISPFIAHAVPSLVGGLVAARIAATREITCALIVGGVHLLGGIAAAILIPAPAWFIALDLLVAYVPMAYVGGRLGMRRSRIG